MPDKRRRENPAPKKKALETPPTERADAAPEEIAYNEAAYRELAENQVVYDELIYDDFETDVYSGLSDEEELSDEDGEDFGGYDLPDGDDEEEDEEPSAYDPAPVRDPRPSVGGERFDEASDRRKRRPLIIAGCVLLLLLIGLAAVLLLSGRSDVGSADAAGEPFQPDIDEGAQAWSGDQLPSQSATPGQSVGIKIPGYPSITIPADTQTVYMALLNPEGNPCYFTFQLVLRDTDEVLYTSKMVPPGTVITEVELSRPLEAGEYDAVIRITTNSLADGSAMNGADVETLLIAQ